MLWEKSTHQRCRGRDALPSAFSLRAQGWLLVHTHFPFTCFGIKVLGNSHFCRSCRPCLGRKQGSDRRRKPCNFKTEKLKSYGLFISFLKPGRISPLLQEDTSVKTNICVFLFVIVRKDFVNSGCVLPTWGASLPCISCSPPALPWVSHGGDARPQAWQPRRVLRGNFPYLLERPRTRLPEV